MNRPGAITLHFLFGYALQGYNEPMRTRVHNNAGSEAVIRESFQLNIDAARNSFGLVFEHTNVCLTSVSFLRKFLRRTRRTR